MSSRSHTLPRSPSRRLALGAAALVIACGLLAPGAAAAVDLGPLYTEANADIPGLPLPASPVVGSLDDTPGIDDWDDVLSVPLDYNQKLTVEMTATAGTDFDLWLWKPGSTTVFDSNPEPHIANASQTRGTSTESFWYPASSAGTYYLDVFSDKATSPNKGSYRLVWSIEQLAAPDMTYSADRTLVNYDGSVTFSGVVTFGGLAAGNQRGVVPAAAGRFEHLDFAEPWQERQTGDAHQRFRRLQLQGRERDAQGRLSCGRLADPDDRMAPRHPGHRYAARVPDSGPTRPRRSPATGDSSVHGYLKSRHASGARNVKVTAYRADSGVWRYAKNYNYSSYTQYKTSLSLPYKGKWKLVATTAPDTYHAATQSSATYVTVR